MPAIPAPAFAAGCLVACAMLAVTGIMMMARVAPDFVGRSVPPPEGTHGVPAPWTDAGQAPTFDVVRVESDGSALVAGRAAPASTVALVIGGATVATAEADAQGQFVILPPPLPPGIHEMTLRATRAPGGATVSAASVTIDLPAIPGRPMVAMAVPGKPTRVLSAPSAGPEPRILSVESETGGKLYVAGRAAALTPVRLSLNGTPVAEGLADAAGDVAFSIAGGIGAGSYAVALAATGAQADGSVARVTFDVPRDTGGAGVKVDRRDGAIQVPALGAAVVSRGDNLWRISRRVYDSGRRYTVIYEANLDRIRSPGRIYPGQVLVLPPAAPGSARP